MIPNPFLRPSFFFFFAKMSSVVGPTSHPSLPQPMALRPSALVLTWTDAQVAAFLQRTIESKEFPLATNHYKLRAYENSFTGVDFVSFLNARQLALSRAAAVTLGRDWLARGFLQHVTLDQHFQDAPHVYRFHNYSLQVTPFFFFNLIFFPEVTLRDSAPSRSRTTLSRFRRRRARRLLPSRQQQQQRRRRRRLNGRRSAWSTTACRARLR